MPDRCEKENQAFKNANGELTDAKEKYDDALEDYGYPKIKMGLTGAAGVSGTAAVVIGIIAGAPTGGTSIPIGFAAAAAFSGATGLATTGAAVAGVMDEERKADRAVRDANGAYIAAINAQKKAQKDLDHCRNDFFFEMGEPIVTDDEDDLPEGDADLPDYMPDGDADFPDYMPDGDADLDDLDDYDEEDEDEEIPENLECDVCGFSGPIGDFGDADDLVCPYCESEVGTDG